jgi:hypothetical protein
MSAPRLRETLCLYATYTLPDPVVPKLPNNPYNSGVTILTCRGSP